MKFLESQPPGWSPQPSLKRSRSYPVFGALPLTASFASAALAFCAVAEVGVAEALAASSDADALKTRQKTRELASSLDLKNFDDAIDECINLTFGIATPFRLKY